MVGRPTGLQGDVSRPSSSRCLQRRRRMLAGLVIVALATFLLAVVESQAWIWGIQLVADVLVVAYVAVLIYHRNAAASMEMTHEALRG